MTAPAQISRLIPHPLQALRQTPCADLWSRMLGVRLLHWPATAVSPSGTTGPPVPHAAQPASPQHNLPAVPAVRAFSGCTSSNTAEQPVATAASHGGIVACYAAQGRRAYPSLATAGLVRAYGHASPPPPGHDLEAESHLLHHRERGTLSLSEAEVTVMPYACPMPGWTLPPYEAIQSRHH